MITEVTPSIAYIGVDDPDLDLFESQYDLPEGMCYNSYVIVDDKVAILDTVDARCSDAWFARLESALGSRTPDYLIVHHLEPDHAGCIATLMERYPTLQLVASAKALKYLPQFFDTLDLTGRTLTVGEGSVLELGHHSLQFVEATFVHWPEVIMSYCPEAHVLFSADAFGKFGVYDADADDWACEARRYYFNICGKYGVQVSKTLAKVSQFAIDSVCPLHGPVLTGAQLAEALRLYTIWSSYGVETEGVFIAHASIHGGTAAAAERLAEILRAKGCPKVAISDICREDMAEAIEDAFRYGRLVCCASSYDGDVFPPMHTFLHKLGLKGYQQRRIALVENGTWAPSAARAMKALIAPMKQIDLVEPHVTLRSRMHEADIPALEALADAVLA